MKIITVLGTRPEIIRLSCLIPLLDRYFDHGLLYTDQNYDKNLKDVFFKNLNMRSPNYCLNTRSSSSMEQIGKIMHGCEGVFLKERPDKVLVLGDTNSALSSFVAKRLGIPVYHMEAGNRCFDNRVPEEVNRKVIDHCSTIHMPYTERSRDNLIKEGIDSRFIYVTGNPIKEVMKKFDGGSEIPFAKPYFLVTLHRAENVDFTERMAIFLKALKAIGEKYGRDIVFSTHPRTKKVIDKYFGEYMDVSCLKFIDPVDFTTFLSLERGAECVLTDSGTVQEECCILNVPNVTLRETTERPETIESGSNILSGCDFDSILGSVEIALGSSKCYGRIPEYEKTNVSETVLKIISST